MEEFKIHRFIHKFCEKYKAFTLAEVTMAQRESGKENKVLFSRKSKPKEPTNKIKKLTAFTMAEVLVTIVIIGIVSSITIPSIVTNYKKHQTVTKLKKTYLIINEALDKAIMVYGSIKNWKPVENKKPKDFFDKYLKSHLNIIKDCEYDMTGDCEFKVASLNTPNDYTLFDGKFSKVILNDGTAIIMYFKNIKPDTPNHVAYLIMYFDVNGNKPPNVFGKDVFMYYLYIKDKDNKEHAGVFIPAEYEKNKDRNYYINGTTQGCSKNKGGSQCAALIMIDNWQMKNDYPW